MNTKSLFDELLSFKCRSLSILALAGFMLPNAVHAGTCDTTFTDLANWLKQSPLNHVTATVASNRPPSWILQGGTSPSGSSEITYSALDLKLVGPTALVGTGTLYYDDHYTIVSPGGFSPSIYYPFNPKQTDTFGLVIYSTGLTYVEPANTTQSFAATCTPQGVFGVMYGQPVSQVVGQLNLAPVLPFYTITFAKWAVEAPPK